MPRADDATIDAPSAGLGALGGAGPGATLAPGDRFAGRYLIESLLGRGGMGSVFRAKDGLLGDEPVALKVLDHASESAVERFRREVLLARRISSPHVARTHDLGSHAGVSYLTMELVVGRSLGAILSERGTLAPGRTARVGAAIARGLAAAHDAGVVHRDLKPDNVLVGDDGRVVVTDFGIARALITPESAKMTGGIVGTPHYMAPEQVAGLEVDARTDLFALGVLLFECVAGQLPYPADTPIAAAVARLQQAPVDLASVKPVAPALAALVMQLLEKDRARRPASAHEVVQRLDALAAQLVDDASGVVTAAAERLPAIVTPSTHTPSTSGGTREHVLAVMPFEHRGAADGKDVADTVRDELVDLLARTRGLRALAKSSVTTADSARLLGATQLVEASIQTGSGKLRANVRLLDVASGVQTWAERIEGDYADPFAGPERAAQRIVEALRLALESVTASSRVPPEAIEHFRDARKRLRTLGFHDPSIVVELLEKSIDLAPTFAPALALHAIAAARAWFSPTTAQTREWGPIVKTSIARALERASHVAESHHAAAMFAWHEGRLRDAAASARRALAIAPTYPDAMAFLGQLETEAGRAEDGLEHVRIAYELEPTLRIGVFEPARWHALYGDVDLADQLIDRMEKELREPALAGQTRVRAGAWRKRPEWIERGVALLQKSNAPVSAPLIAYGMTALGKAPFIMPDTAFFTRTSPRFASVALQILAEAAMIAEEEAAALDAIGKAADLVLADLQWMDHCPLFAPLREKPEFQAARAKVAERVEDIWV